MSELLIKVGSKGTDPAQYQDGDVLMAFSQRRIKHAHAQHICRADRKRNRDGLLVRNGLCEAEFKRTAKFKFQRVSRHEVLRTNLTTLAQETLGTTPNTGGEYIHVEEFLKRRLRHPKNIIFGEVGAEIWYGGSNPTVAAVDNMWVDIHSNSDFLEANHRLWPMGRNDLTDHFAVKVENITDAQANPLMLGENDVEGKIVKRRVNKLPLDALPLTGKTIDDIRNPNVSVDTRQFENSISLVESK